MNGLPRNYCRKHSELRVHGADHLATVADAIDDRPRETLTWGHIS